MILQQLTIPLSAKNTTAAGMLIFLLAAIPFAFDNKGIFFYYGDFNSQQLPLMLHLTENISAFKFPQYDFMAVPVSEGTHTIELVYHSDERTIGIIMSIIGITGLAFYAAIMKMFAVKKTKQIAQ